MVSFIPQGRAGNFFFECATSLAYAKRNGLDFSVPFRTSSDYWSPIYLKHLQNKSYNESLPSVRVTEKHFHYAPIGFQEEWRDKNIILHGYFQAPAFFEEYRNEILEAFALPWELKPDLCSIHARYGDYLTIEGKHIIIDEPYLKQAMQIITERTGIVKFKVFSDDVPLFKERLGHLYDFEYSTNTNEIDDLVEISCCHSHINSSSTFSFWGAWLNKNPNKVIITNKQWFQLGWRDEHGVVDTSHIIPSKWVKI